MVSSAFSPTRRRRKAADLGDGLIPPQFESGGFATDRMLDLFRQILLHPVGPRVPGEGRDAVRQGSGLPHVADQHEGADRTIAHQIAETAQAADVMQRWGWRSA